MGGISELWVTHRTILCIWSNVAWVNFYNGIRKGKTWVEQSTFPCCLWAKRFLSSGVLLLFKLLLFCFPKPPTKMHQSKENPGDDFTPPNRFAYESFVVRCSTTWTAAAKRGGGGGGGGRVDHPGGWSKTAVNLCQGALDRQRSDEKWGPAGRELLGRQKPSSLSVGPVNTLHLKVINYQHNGSRRIFGNALPPPSIRKLHVSISALSLFLWTGTWWTIISLFCRVRFLMSKTMITSELFVFLFDRDRYWSLLFASMLSFTKTPVRFPASLCAGPFWQNS